MRVWSTLTLTFSRAPRTLRLTASLSEQGLSAILQQTILQRLLSEWHNAVVYCYNYDDQHTSIMPHCTTHHTAHSARAELQMFCNPGPSYSAQVSPFSLPLGSPQRLWLRRGREHRGVSLGVRVRVLHPAPAIHQLWERQTGEDSTESTFNENESWVGIRARPRVC